MSDDAPNPRYNVIVNSDHLLVMAKVEVIWGKIPLARRLALRDAIDAKVDEIGALVHEAAS